jgi:hypothetical protein
MAKGKRGAKFTIAELECLLDVIDEIVPIGNPDWERVWDKHVSTFPTKERTVESLKQKFQGLTRHKIPTGDPECPPHICNAKRIYRKIVLATDGSTGGSDGSDDEREDDAEEDEEGNEEEEEEEEGDGANTSFDFSVNDEQEPEEAELEAEPEAVAAAAGGKNHSLGKNCSLSSSTQSSTSKGKRKEGGGGNQSTKSRAFKMPLKSPRKKSRESADSDNDGTPFENMMNYMMFQNRMETEQREHQMKADKEDRDREYQLRHEEMVIQREDNRAQHNMMNVMMMAMLGGHQGGHRQGPPQQQPQAPLIDQDNDNEVVVVDDAPGNV